MRSLGAVLLPPALLFSSNAASQTLVEHLVADISAPDTEQAIPAEMERVSQAPSRLTIPALTPVTLAVLAELSSNESAQGDSFPIVLAQAIVLDGVEVVPAGTEGVGEVVHAKTSGGMGAAGELILTARYLEYEGQQIDLRSFRIDAEATSRINTVNTVNVVSAASPIPIGLVGFFIKGGALTIADGTLAVAKTRSDVEITLPFELAPPEPEDDIGPVSAIAASQADEPALEGDLPPHEIDREQIEEVVLGEVE